MKYGVLEVLLVSGEGLKKTHLLGSSSQYVVMQCGTKTCTSKTSTGKNEKVWWNEKITFKLPSSQWKALTQLRITVMEKDKFTHDLPIGEAIVHLRAILREGEKKGHMELKPAPYNVVLKDGSYEGELKLGFKFISNVDAEFLDDEKNFRRG
ncbi:16 kDa phloem protein 1 [Dioscorea cayenensis subsp. rotundata]|uniref:16 kDa phloem protein 1 n=1 Tax=Dioscorea cayennensis subsp. rotundata TaxID=55577 RepID=A0AB40CB42_DIOCR|nr:16 kDa phloem protein 1 [Dioscorea cayenensis subsp. rotundata]